MRFIVSMSILNVDESTINREVQSDNFTDAVEHYMSAVEHGKGEVRWGADAREVRITFVAKGRTTEITKVRFSLGGELEVVATQF